MWKICYLGAGRYSIRPLHKLSMTLDVDNGNVEIYSGGIQDSLGINVVRYITPDSSVYI